MADIHFSFAMQVFTIGYTVYSGFIQGVGDKGEEVSRFLSSNQNRIIENLKRAAKTAYDKNY